MKSLYRMIRVLLLSNLRYETSIDHKFVL